MIIKVLHGILSDTRIVLTEGVLSVKVYRTHAGNGNTTQYTNYPSTTAEFDRLFDTAFTNTTLSWQGNLNATPAINFTQYTQLTGAGVTLASGDYFSLMAEGTFIPVETGNYTFAINSDDGSDLFIGGNFVVSYYGGHGMTGPMTGTISLTAGTQYSFRARMQEYGGGEGLTVTWSRPSQGTSYTLQTAELGLIP